MAAVAGLYGLGDDSRQYRRKQQSQHQHQLQMNQQYEKPTPDGLSEP